MGVKKEGNLYLVESSSKKGSYYKVDPGKPMCTCAHFIFRMKNMGGECKHIRQVRKMLVPDKTKLKQIISDIWEGNNDCVELVERYGEDAVNYLKNKGDVFEKSGKLHVLE